MPPPGGKRARLEGVLEQGSRPARLGAGQGTPRPLDRGGNYPDTGAERPRPARPVRQAPAPTRTRDLRRPATRKGDEFRLPVTARLLTPAHIRGRAGALPVQPGSKPGALERRAPARPVRQGSSPDANSRPPQTRHRQTRRVQAARDSPLAHASPHPRQGGSPAGPARPEAWRSGTPRSSVAGSAGLQP